MLPSETTQASFTKIIRKWKIRNHIKNSWDKTYSISFFKTYLLSMNY